MNSASLFAAVLVSIACSSVLATPLPVGPPGGYTQAGVGAGFGAGAGAGVGAGFGQSAGVGAGFGAGAGAGAGFGQSAGIGGGFGQSAGIGAGFEQSAGIGAGFGQSAGVGAGFGQGVGLGAGFGAEAEFAAGAGAGAGFFKRATPDHDHADHAGPHHRREEAVEAFKEVEADADTKAIFDSKKQSDTREGLIAVDSPVQAQEGYTRRPTDNNRYQRRQNAVGAFKDVQTDSDTKATFENQKQSDTREGLIAEETPSQAQDGYTRRPADKSSQYQRRQDTLGAFKDVEKDSDVKATFDSQKKTDTREGLIAEDTPAQSQDGYTQRPAVGSTQATQLYSRQEFGAGAGAGAGFEAGAGFGAGFGGFEQGGRREGFEAQGGRREGPEGTRDGINRGQGEGQFLPPPPPPPPGGNFLPPPPRGSSPAGGSEGYTRGTTIPPPPYSANGARGY